MKHTLKLLAISALAMLVITSCNNSKHEGFDSTENGLHYKLLKTSQGKEKVKKGDVISLILTYSTMKDSLLFDSRNMGRPFMLKVDKSDFKGDLTEGFQLLSEGDSAQFILNADSFFIKTAKMDVPAEIKKGSEIKFNVKVLTVKTEKQFKEEQDKMMAERNKKNELNKQMEDSLLKKYIVDNKITEKPSSTGIYTLIKTKGSGTTVAAGDTIEVKYKGTLLDGKEFDNSERSPVPVKFPIGVGMVIPGWDEAIVGMKAGTKAKLVIPSAMAYGAQGGGPIEPFSPLVFDIEIVKVFKKK